jgi:hypothetical protein
VEAWESFVERKLGTALIVAAITSSAAFAAPKGGSSGSGTYQPGTLFNCVIPMTGPKGFRIGGCWLAE